MNPITNTDLLFYEQVILALTIVAALTGSLVLYHLLKFIKTFRGKKPISYPILSEQVQSSHGYSPLGKKDKDCKAMANSLNNPARFSVQCLMGQIVMNKQWIHHVGSPDDIRPGWCKIEFKHYNQTIFTGKPCDDKTPLPQGNTLENLWNEQYKLA